MQLYRFAMDADEPDVDNLTEGCVRTLVRFYANPKIMRAERIGRFIDGAKMPVVQW